LSLFSHVRSNDFLGNIGSGRRSLCTSSFDSSQILTM
jgi:hypothetical protein